MDQTSLSSSLPVSGGGAMRVGLSLGLASTVSLGGGGGRCCAVPVSGVISWIPMLLLLMI
jgi:hypothetical protein